MKGGNTEKCARFGLHRVLKGKRSREIPDPLGPGTWGRGGEGGESFRASLSKLIKVSYGFQGI